jgi:hypothetical protein
MRVHFPATCHVDLLVSMEKQHRSWQRVPEVGNELQVRPCLHNAHDMVADHLCCAVTGVVSTMGRDTKIATQCEHRRVQTCLTATVMEGICEAIGRPVLPPTCLMINTHPVEQHAVP